MQTGSKRNAAEGKDPFWRDSPSVFVVGASRSGTELLRAVLNGHPAVRIARETHYFDDLRPRLTGGGPATPDAAERAHILARFAVLNAGAYGYGDVRFETDPAEGTTALDQAAAALAPSADAIFAAHCAGPDLSRIGPQRIWGEKTPRHIFRGAEILTALPGARLIVAVRDPRGAAASYRDWTNRWFDGTDMTAGIAQAVATEERRVRQSWSLTLSALLWRSAMTTAHRLRDEFGPDRVHLLRFEDLVTCPDQTIAALCAFLKLPVDPGMANVTVVNSSYIGRDRQGGFRAEAAARWQRALSPAEQRHIGRVCGSMMQRMGYVENAGNGHYAFSAVEFLRFGLALPRAIFANRKRIGNLPQAILARCGGILPIRSRYHVQRIAFKQVNTDQVATESAVVIRAHSASVPGSPRRNQDGE